MAKQRNDYFGLIESQLECSTRVADLLEDMLTALGAGNISEKQAVIHKTEQEADELHHDILTRLSAEFITPFDQEDILRLVQIIDDVTDSLDDVALNCRMYHVTSVDDDVRRLASTVTKCVKTLYGVSKELKNYKKPTRLRALIVDVNTIEGEADEIYVDTIEKLFLNENDFKKLIGVKSVCDSLENCCDLCEHAAEVIEQIIIKNT
mgnify:FL=1